MSSLSLSPITYTQTKKRQQNSFLLFRVESHKFVGKQMSGKEKATNVQSSTKKQFKDFVFSAPSPSLCLSISSWPTAVLYGCLSLNKHETKRGERKKEGRDIFGCVHTIDSSQVVSRLWRNLSPLGSLHLGSVEII